MKTLFEQLGKPVMYHRVGWHGKDGVSVTGYDSRDPGVINRQLKAIQEHGGEGAGVIHLTYGPTVSPFIHQASMAVCNQCCALGMPFALCFDPWTVKTATDKTAAMITALSHPEIQMMLNSPTYYRSTEGQVVLDFDTGVNPMKIDAAFPFIDYWMKDVDYDWPKIPPQANKTARPAVFMKFDDGTGADRNKQADDQTKPARIVPEMAGRTFWGCNIPTATEFVQVCTLDDEREQTALEAAMSMVTGRI